MRGTKRHMEAVAGAIGSEDAAPPAVRKITYADLRVALRKGRDDFAACRTDVVLLCVLYPIIGMSMGYVALRGDLLPLAFPIVSGFALVGPAAAVGLYEMSRLREQGRSPNWGDALAVTRSPSFGAIFALALMLGVTFLVWLLTAQGIYAVTMGPDAPGSLPVFLTDVFTTTAGWTMALLGLGVGFIFAALVLATSVISFPMLIDRNVGLPVAVVTSIRVAEANPGPIAAWGLIVAGLIALGSIPAFLGLIVVLPVLGHATWHLYRRAVV